MQLLHIVALDLEHWMEFGGCNDIVLIPGAFTGASSFLRIEKYIAMDIDFNSCCGCSSPIKPDNITGASCVKMYFRRFHSHVLICIIRYNYTIPFTTKYPALCCVHLIPELLVQVYYQQPNKLSRSILLFSSSFSYSFNDVHDAFHSNP